MNTILSTNGRIGRGAYALRLFLITAGTYATCFAAGTALRFAGAMMDRDMQAVINVVAILIGVSGSVLAALQAAKRLHDLGRSGAHYFLLLLPFYNLYLSLQLLFRKGQEASEPVRRRPGCRRQA